MSSKQAESSKKSAVMERAPSAPRYVHEIVVSVQPFDVLLWCPLFVSMLDIFRTDGTLQVSSSDSDISELQSKPRLARLPAQRTYSTTSILSPSDSYPRSSTASQKSASTSSSQEWISSRSLPLVYLDCKEVRIFAPTRQSSSLSDHGARAMRIESDEDESDVSMETQDTFLLQVNSVCLVPHADNPLQRLVLKKEIFR